MYSFQPAICQMARIFLAQIPYGEHAEL